MPAEFYRLLHFTGVFLILLAFGGLVIGALRGGEPSAPGRKLSSISHGVGLLLVLIAGFGMLAKLGITWPWPGWVWGKVVLWLVLGGVIAVVRRKPSASAAVWWVALVGSVVAAYLAGYKPF